MRYLLFGVLLLIGSQLMGQVPDSLEIYEADAKAFSYVIPLYDQAVFDTVRKATIVPIKQISIDIVKENVRIYNGQVWYILTPEDKKLFENTGKGPDKAIPPYVVETAQGIKTPSW